MIKNVSPFGYLRANLQRLFKKTIEKVIYLLKCTISPMKYIV